MAAQRAGGYKDRRGGPALADEVIE